MEWGKAIEYFSKSSSFEVSIGLQMSFDAKTYFLYNINLVSVPLISFKNGKFVNDFHIDNELSIGVGPVSAQISKETKLTTKYTSTSLTEYSISFLGDVGKLAANNKTTIDNSSVYKKSSEIYYEVTNENVIELDASMIIGISIRIDIDNLYKAFEELFDIIK